MAKGERRMASGEEGAGLESGPAFGIHSDSGPAFDLTQEQPQLGDRVLRIGRQGESVVPQPHEEVPATRLRGGETECAEFADEVASLAGRPARYVSSSLAAAFGHG